MSLPGAYRARRIAPRTRYLLLVDDGYEAHDTAMQEGTP